MDTPLMTKVKLVNTWLEEQYLIKVPLAWLKSCIQKVLDEPAFTITDDDRLKSAVFNFWLNTDLCEIACDKLPENLHDVPALKIEGCYNLQINKLQDISQSPYDQWLKLIGYDNENVRVTAETFSFKEEKASRVLKIELTDGFQIINAVEFSTVSTLSVNTKPGTKIRLCGPFNCYCGQVMLTKENVIIYGGQVESLLQKNCQYNILARLLGYPELQDEDEASKLNSNTISNETGRSEQEQQILLENDNVDMIFEDEAIFDLNDDFDDMIQNEEESAVNSNSHQDYDDEPYTYLAKALDSELTCSKSVFVKAFVGTFTGKLERNAEKNEYSLNVVINDGTMAVEATISNEVIKDIIGVEAKDFNQTYAANKKAFTKKLATLNTIMKIELNPPPLAHKILAFEEDVEKLQQLLLKSFEIDFSEIGINSD